MATNLNLAVLSTVVIGNLFHLQWDNANDRGTLRKLQRPQLLLGLSKREVH